MPASCCVAPELRCVEALEVDTDAEVGAGEAEALVEAVGLRAMAVAGDREFVATGVAGEVDGDAHEGFAAAMASGGRLDDDVPTMA